MQMEEKIIGMLEEIMAKQDEHTKKLDEHSIKLDEHTKKLDEHTRKLDDHAIKLDNHDAKFEDHGQMLRALLSGQEHLKAELDGMKVGNAKEFGKLNDRMDGFDAELEVLRDDVWKNKTDTHRLKNLIGIV